MPAPIGQPFPCLRCAARSSVSRICFKHNCGSRQTEPISRYLLEGERGISSVSQQNLLSLWCTPQTTNNKSTRPKQPHHTTAAHPAADHNPTQSGAFHNFWDFNPQGASATTQAMTDVDMSRRNKKPRLLLESERARLEEFIDSIGYSARCALTSL